MHIFCIGRQKKRQWNVFKIIYIIYCIWKTCFVPFRSVFAVWWKFPILAIFIISFYKLVLSNFINKENKGKIKCKLITYHKYGWPIKCNYYIQYIKSILKITYDPSRIWGLFPSSKASLSSSSIPSGLMMYILIYTVFKKINKVYNENFCELHACKIRVMCKQNKYLVPEALH